VCGLAFVSMGCQEDNEAAIKQQEAKSSDSQVKDALPPPKTQAEYGDRMKAQQSYGNYPGAKKKG
jgi:ubiquitin